MELPTLYRKTAKGQIYQWTIKSIDDGNREKSEEMWLEIVYGMMDGKMVTQKRKISPKGKKTPWEQAIFNMKKKWEDRKNKDGYTEAIQEERPFFTPMLAQTLKMKKDKKTGVLEMDMKPPFYVQPKLDGFRCMATYEGDKNGAVKLLSRKNVEYNGLATLKDVLLMDIYARLPKDGFGSGSFYVDGELMISDVPFEELSGTIKRAQYHSDVDIPTIQYHIFDCFDTQFMDTPFSARTKFLREIIDNENKNLRYVPTIMIETEKEMKNCFSQFIKSGYEGLIARVSSSAYKPNKRPSCLKKYKEMMDSEFEIIGYNEAEGEDKGTVIWICKTESGQKFSVRPRGTRELRREWFENGEDYIGKNLTVIYQELSEIGVPRFPVGKCIRD